MTAAAPGRPRQRVGHIGDTDNRFCGGAVFAQLAAEVEHPTDLLLRGLGVPTLSADDREVVRCMTLAATSADARVWPLKLTRLLAAYGNPYAGHYGAQLGAFGERMGPGATTRAATALAALATVVGDALEDPDVVTRAVTTHLAAHQRIVGFGVPFRPHDERLRGLRQLLAGHPATRRPRWRLHDAVIVVMRREHQLEPNILWPLAALMLDLGVAPARTSLLASLLTTHVFAAHAVEAAADDGVLLRELPAAAVTYRGRPPRPLPAR